MVFGALAPPAVANSTTGIAEYSYDQCFYGALVPSPTQLLDAATGLLGLSDPRCRDIALDQTTRHVNDETYVAGSAVNIATAAPETVEAGLTTAMAAAGEGVAQAAELLGLPVLTASWSAAEGAIWAAVLFTEGKASIATEQAIQTTTGWAGTVLSHTQADPLYCVWVPTPCMIPIGTYSAAQTNPRDQMGYDDPSNFQWRADIEMWWDPNGNGKGAADGGAYSNLYRATRQDNPSWRFWATSQAHSLTPINGWKLKKMQGVISSEQLQRVEMSPLSTSKFGSNGTISVGVTLGGEKGGGTSFSVGRTWNISEGTAGGAMVKGGHLTIFEAQGGGTTWTKSTEGAETWKIPPGDSFQWWYQIDGWLQK
jgi:hypothetical protein